MTADVRAALAADAAIIEGALAKYLTPDKTYAPHLTEAMAYSTLGGGKRIRAFLTLEFCRMFGGTERAALPFASAVEMIQAYSLIHDDMPCMDNDDMRRGKPSCHKKFSEGVALLAGDSLLTYAFQVLAENRYVTPDAVRRATVTLAGLAGIYGMCAGQYIDLSSDSATYDDLKHLHSLKTGALIQSAAMLGYIASGSAENPNIEKDIEKYSQSLGLAFQITDDLLDFKGDAAVLGKPVGSDEKNGRKTSLSFMSVTEAEKEAERLALEAAEAVSGYSGSDLLCKLPVYLVGRSK